MSLISAAAGSPAGGPAALWGPLLLLLFFGCKFAFATSLALSWGLRGRACGGCATDMNARTLCDHTHTHHPSPYRLIPLLAFRSAPACPHLARAISLSPSPFLERTRAAPVLLRALARKAARGAAEEIRFGVGRHRSAMGPYGSAMGACAASRRCGARAGGSDRPSAGRGGGRRGLGRRAGAPRCAGAWFWVVHSGGSRHRAAARAPLPPAAMARAGLHGARVRGTRALDRRGTALAPRHRPRGARGRPVS